MAEDLRSLYRTYFDVLPDVGSDPELLAEALKLRYQVYCIEQGYEDAAAFPDGLEHDTFDRRSLHTLLVHRTSHQVAGTVRLIRPHPDRPVGSLPIDDLCGDDTLQDQAVLPRAGLAEVSRFAVSKAFRRRIEDAPTPMGVGPGWEERRSAGQRRVPHLSLGLVQAMVYNSVHQGITHWVAEMEPALLRMYEKLGIHWLKLGPIVDFHGRRQPCYVQVDQMLARTRDERFDVWDLITDGGSCVPPGLEPAVGDVARRA